MEFFILHIKQHLSSLRFLQAEQIDLQVIYRHHFTHHWKLSLQSFLKMHKNIAWQFNEIEKKRKNDWKLLSVYA